MSQAPEDTNVFPMFEYHYKSDNVTKDSLTYITIGGKPVI